MAGEGAGRLVVIAAPPRVPTMPSPIEMPAPGERERHPMERAERMRHSDAPRSIEPVIEPVPAVTGNGVARRTIQVARAAWQASADTGDAAA